MKGLFWDILTTLIGLMVIAKHKRIAEMDIEQAKIYIFPKPNPNGFWMKIEVHKWLIVIGGIATTVIGLVGVYRYFFPL